MVQLKIGDSIEIDGIEFVITSTQILHDSAGRSVTLHAKDPLLAVEMMQKLRMQRDVLENTNKMLLREQDGA